MKKAEFLKALSKETGFTIKDVSAVVAGLETVIINNLAKGEKIPLIQGIALSTGFREERLGRNPSTGEDIVIPAKHTPKCNFSKKFKDLIAEEYVGE